MGPLLRAVTAGAITSTFSNGCATRSGALGKRAVLVALVAFGSVSVSPGRALAQTAESAATTSSEHPIASVGKFLAGGALGLAAHEGGHLLFDGIFDANPGIKKVSFHGIPFFAITHDSGLPPAQEFVIDSAGFWVQQLGNEIILTRRPDLRHEHAPVLKGMVAFNVFASVAYAGAAFAQTGPEERDTRGMAESLGWKEPWVGALILAPAILDAIRYFRPDAKWAAWGSRGVKVVMVLLVFSANGG